tara:strand:+ start:535 stop:702 length:168 start_codon:yes stop_codon:yes gene_type:complete
MGLVAPPKTIDIAILAPDELLVDEAMGLGFADVEVLDLEKVNIRVLLLGMAGRGP